MRSRLAALFLCLPARAWAEEPPMSQALLDDTKAWEMRARALLDGPDACVQLAGTVRYEVALFRPGGWLGPGEQRSMVTEGSFEGTLDHGLWTVLESHLVPQGDDNLNIDDIYPMVGRLPPDPGAAEGQEHGGEISIGTGSQGTTVDVASSSAQAMNLLDEIIDGIDPAVTTAYATWDADERAVVLREWVPLDDGRTPPELQLVTLFPGGESPTVLEAVFPKRYTVRQGPLKITLLNAQLHLRATPTPFGPLPGQEGLSLVVGVLGMTLGVEQQITYQRFRECPP